MDEETNQLINETLDTFFESAPGREIKKGVRPEYYDICPHCNEEIYERHEYTEDGGKSWRHSECKGLITRPTASEELFPGIPDKDTTDGLKQLGDGGFPSSGPGSGDQYLGDEAEFGLQEEKDFTSKTEMPPSGEEKYSKQEPGGAMATANVATIANEGTSGEEEQTQILGPRQAAKFFDSQYIIMNKSQNTVMAKCTRLQTDIKTGGKYSAFYTSIQDT